MRFQLGGEQLVQEMTPDPLDVVDFNIETPIIETPTPQPVTQPQPEPVAQPQPQPVAQPQPEAQPQPAVQQPVNEENVRRAPNGEIIPPLEPEDKGELDEDFQKFDLTAKEPTVTKNVGGRNIDLPKKKEPSIKLDEIEGPQNVVCKCGPDDVCPACEEQKIGTY
jgi:hypothetical protein